MKSITFKKFTSEVERFNQKALYILQIPVNLSKTVEKQSVVSGSATIERIWAICPYKKKVYTETFFIEDRDNLKDLSYNQIAQSITEEELAQILMQLKSNMYDLSYEEYELLYNTKVRRPKPYEKRVILTVAVDIDVTKNFDIDYLSIDEISFTNPEVITVNSANCDIIEQV